MNGELEQLAPGIEVQRSPEGTFEKVTLTSERAREIQAKRMAKKDSEFMQEVREALEAYGFNDENPAPVVIRKLVEQICRGGAGIGANIAHLRKFTAQDTGDYQGKVPKGEVCPLCGQVNFSISADAARLIIGLLHDRVIGAADEN